MFYPVRKMFSRATFNEASSERITGLEAKALCRFLESVMISPAPVETVMALAVSSAWLPLRSPASGLIVIKYALNVHSRTIDARGL